MISILLFEILYFKIYTNNNTNELEIGNIFGNYYWNYEDVLEFTWDEKLAEKEHILNLEENAKKISNIII